MQRMGAEIVAVNTVQFSNHTGYGSWTGQALDGTAVQALVNGIASRGVLPRIDAVLSGYLGNPAVADAVLDAVTRVREANPAALYCCDPVIGDTRPGIYVQPGVLIALRDRAVPAADILTPNQFELAALTGLPVTTLDDAIAAAGTLRHRMRPEGTVLITSLQVAETEPGTNGMLVVDQTGASRVITPHLPIEVNGAGDVTAALFLLHLLRTRNAPSAMAATAASLHGLLRRTLEAGQRELAIVAAQDEFVAPTQTFSAIPC